MTRATESGTSTFAMDAVRGGANASHFRKASGLTLSSLGMGTYLGEPDDETDSAYLSAIVEAAKLGCNVFDAAANYRCQRSERALGAALKDLAAHGVTRERVVLSTKGGYIPFDGSPPEDVRQYLHDRFVDPGIFAPADIASGSHVLTPAFIRDQLERSIENLDVDTVDIYYLHNPEAQLAAFDRETLAEKMRGAFTVLEQAVADAKIGFYGVATWDGLRSEPDGGQYLSLAELVKRAHEVAGEDHHLRFVQLPHNLGMTEAFTVQNQTVDGVQHSLLQAAEQVGVHVVASASLAQGGLTTGLPDWLQTIFKGLSTDAQRSLQFVRSTPGITTALVGMRSLVHVRENLGIAAVAPAEVREFLSLFEVDSTE